MPEPAYSLAIERGYSEVNDRIIDYLKPRIRRPWLDIGCNSGWLLSEVPGGIGIDASKELVLLAIGKGLEARRGNAEEELPFDDGQFETAVLSCVLEQCCDWRKVLREAERVARHVIGVNPSPFSSPWGSVGGWVKSVISTSEMHARDYRTFEMDTQRYYFEK